MKKNFKSILKIFFFTIFFGFFWVENVFAEIFTLAGKNDTINFNSDTTIQLNTVNKTIS